MIRFGIKFLEICFEKIISFEVSSQTYIKIKDLDYLLKNQQFRIDYTPKLFLLDEKKFGNATCMLFFICYIVNTSDFYSE